MSKFKIIKKGANNFWHWFNNDAKKVAISSFAVVLEEVSQTFSIVYLNGANVPQQAVNVLDIEVIDETDASVVETFTNVIDLRARLVELGYTAYLIGGGIDNITGLIAEGTNVTITGDGTLANPYVISASGGGGAVDSVNGQTGVVVLDADDISETATRFWLTNILKTAYDGAVTWISTNGTNILNHIASTSNPHNVTKSQVGLSNVVNADTTTTANITDSTNKRFVTDANLVVIGNTSGTNSGDNATNTTSNAYADGKVASELASFKTANFLDFTSSGQTQLDGKQNISEIVSANKTAVNDMSYVVTATCTFTDPTPAEGKGYDVFVRNGIATIGGVAYSEGTEITRVYHSGSWKSYAEGEWVDFSVSTTVTTWVTPTITFLQFMLKGNSLTIRGRLTGVSNSASSPTITIPFTLANLGTGQGDFSLLYVNNSISSPTSGVVVGIDNSNQIQFFRDGSLGVLSWTASGTKTIAFLSTFIIQRP